MFPLPPSWDPLPGGTAIPLLEIGFPLIVVGLLAVLACAVILGVDQTRKRMTRRKARALTTSATRSDAVIQVGRTSVPHAAAGGRR
jgi:hypothetical protein